eukprot:GEMP01023063.1.p1 GENE.GEMP01023063.1~~GEMP01023063.1.p1  ORF type:complete len:614 (+),score=139.80 GEMP01023063.1:121-1962(+)
MSWYPCAQCYQPVTCDQGQWDYTVDEKNPSFYCVRCVREWYASSSHSTEDKHQVARNYDAVCHAFDTLDRAAFRAVNNAIVRLIIDAALGGRGTAVEYLIDLACGKGGGAPKYLPYVTTDVRLVDISPESIREAEARLIHLTTQKPTCGRAYHRGVRWHVDVADCFARSYWTHIASASIDAISCQFAIHYAFGDLEEATKVMSEIGRVLREGGVFFGTTVDASALYAEIRKKAKEGEKESHEEPAPFRISEVSAQVPALGGRYVFELPGHVAPTAEYCLPQQDFQRIGRAAGLVPITDDPRFWQNFRDLYDRSKWAALDTPTRRLCQLYCSFGFYKPEAAAQREVHADPRRMAFYTGTFDPIHVNHVAIMRHLLEREDYSHITICVNGDNPYKPYTTPFSDRCAMLHKALEDEVLTDKCSLHDDGREVTQLNWEGRLSICQALLARGGLACVDIVVGQDAFEKSIARAAHTWKGIWNIAHSRNHCIGLVVLPRATLGESATTTISSIPTELRRKVRVLESYRDGISVSSSRIRCIHTNAACLSSDNDTDEAIHTMLPPSVIEYIRAQGLYQPVANSKKLCVLLGPPCLTTVLAPLLAHYGPSKLRGQFFSPPH